MTKFNKDLDALIERLADIKAQKKVILDEEADVQQKVLDLQTKKTYETEDGITSTKVEGTMVMIDEAKLKKALGSVMWNKITTRVLDKSKLDAFIKAGEIKMPTVARASTEKPKKPYVNITRH